MKKTDNIFLSWLAAKRENKRLKRLRRSRFFKKHGYRRNKRLNFVTIPQKLNLEDCRGKLLSLLKNIQKAILYNKYSTLDHRYMEDISDSALLILTAEIERCLKIKGLAVRGNGKYFPKSDFINSLLIKIGYWDHFNIPANKNKLTDNTKLLHLKIVSSIH
ncbi:MAG: hypothetical protein D3922_12540 [Candidatus Electrothrix sp. AR1]|nr:hypothetical protein [Candidatus Electrothrix sp. AR1]